MRDGLDDVRDGAVSFGMKDGKRNRRLIPARRKRKLPPDAVSAKQRAVPREKLAELLDRLHVAPADIVGEPLPDLKRFCQLPGYAEARASAIHAVAARLASNGFLVEWQAIQEKTNETESSLLHQVGSGVTPTPEQLATLRAWDVKRRRLFGLKKLALGLGEANQIAADLLREANPADVPTLAKEVHEAAYNGSRAKALPFFHALASEVGHPPPPPAEVEQLLRTLELSKLNDLDSLFAGNGPVLLFVKTQRERHQASFNSHCEFRSTAEVATMFSGRRVAYFAENLPVFWIQQGFWLAETPDAAAFLATQQKRFPVLADISPPEAGTLRRLISELNLHRYGGKGRLKFTHNGERQPNATLEAELNALQGATAEGKNQKVRLESKK